MKNTFINWIANRFGVPQSALAYLKPMSIAGQQNRIGIPKDLVSLNILNLMRGIYNRIIFSTYLNWVWPYWVIRQYDSKSLSFIPRGFQIPSINVGHRNWTGIGNLYKEKEAIIDPRGLVTANIDSWSVDIFATHRHKLYAPSQLDQVKQRVLHSIPMIETSFEVDNFVILLTTFTELVENRDVIFQQVQVTNHGHQGDTIRIDCSIRPYNPEGISLINKIHYENNLFFVNGSLGLIALEKPHHVLCSNRLGGDVTLQYNAHELKNTHNANCNTGLCTASAGYQLYLNPSESKTLEFRIPMDRSIVIPKVAYLQGHFEDYQQHAISSWKAKTKESMQITLPDKKLEKAFKTNISYLLMLWDGNSITPGPFNYHHFWFRDAAYLLQALCKMGYKDETKQVLNTYPSRQKWNGFFFSQLGEWDSNGQAIWTIAEYYRITHDKATLRKLIPSVVSGANWIINKLATTDKLPIPYKGLMPVGLSAEHFGANDVYFWDDYWSLKGLFDAKFLIDEWPEGKIQTQHIVKAIDKLTTNLNNSIQWANNKFDKPLLPIAPDRHMDSGAIGSLAVAYPLNLFPLDDERLVNTVEWLVENCFTNNVFYHDINHSGHGTYLNLHFSQYFLMRRDPRALDILNWMTNVASNTFTWPESIHPFTFGGVVGDGHHGWAAADYLMTVRNLLFFEEKETLVLTPVIPKEWISLYEKIEVHQAPSYFGIIDFTYEVTHTNEIKITLMNQFSTLPLQIEINLPVFIESIQIGEDIQVINQHRFIISPTTEHVRVFFREG